MKGVKNAVLKWPQIRRAGCLGYCPQVEITVLCNEVDISGGQAGKTTGAERAEGHRPLTGCGKRLGNGAELLHAQLLGSQRGGDAERLEQGFGLRCRLSQA